MMKRSVASWEPQHRASLRHRVALEAARLLYSREFKEYYQAKREAARRHGCTQIPTNREVHEHLLHIARTVDGDAYASRLGDMRGAALRLMECLQAFQPRLIGSVLTGHIRKGSDIDLNVYADELDDVLGTLNESGYAYDVQVVRTRKLGEEQVFTHVRVPDSRGGLPPSAVRPDDAGGYPAEITVYPLEQVHVRSRCGITGGPMRRASLAEARQLFGALPGIRPDWQLPLGAAELVRLVPELAACQGVLQNDYHHLDVYHHTLDVLSGLQRMVADGFGRFRLADRLIGHLAEPCRRNLLYLAAICHDLGKPATQSFGRDGRIHFYGHEDVGAGLAPRIAERLKLSPDEGEGLTELVACHMEVRRIPGEGGEPSRIHRLFRRLGQRLPELALLSIADLEAARGPAQSELAGEEQAEFVDFLLEQFFQGGFLANPVLPVTADDLVETFGIRNEKEQRRLLDELLDLFLDGEIAGLEDGLAVAAELLETSWSRSGPD